VFRLVMVLRMVDVCALKLFVNE